MDLKLLKIVICNLWIVLFFVLFFSVRYYFCFVFVFSWGVGGGGVQWLMDSIHFHLLYLFTSQYFHDLYIYSFYFRFMVKIISTQCTRTSIRPSNGCQQTCPQSQGFCISACFPRGPGLVIRVALVLTSSFACIRFCLYGLLTFFHTVWLWYQDTCDLKDCVQTCSSSSSHSSCWFTSSFFFFWRFYFIFIFL